MNLEKQILSMLQKLEIKNELVQVNWLKRELKGIMEFANEAEPTDPQIDSTLADMVQAGLVDSYHIRGKVLYARSPKGKDETLSILESFPKLGKRS
jgi:DNA-binding PadR family transcriptional regulator